MKKLLLLLLLIPIGVNAAEYSEFKICNESDIHGDVKTEQRNKFYKTNKILGPYELESITNNEYPLIDYNDYIFSDYTDWTFDIEDKDFEAKEVFKYKTVEDTNEIFLGDFSNPDYYVDITSINVFYDGNKIPYNFSCTFCGVDFYKKLIDEGHAKMETNGKVILRLNKDYETEKLSVEVNYNSNNNATTWISAKYKKDDLINADGSIVRSGILGPASLNVNMTNLKLKNEDKIVYSDNELSKLTFVSKETMYRYRDKLYRKYNEKKIYTDYLKNGPEGYEKDLNNYQTYCSYIMKEKANDENLNVEQIINDIPLKIDTQKDDTSIIEETIKLDGNNKDNNRGKIASEKRLETEEDKNYSFLYLFFIIPILILIKIILVLSKLYKKNKKSDNL